MAPLKIPATIRTLGEAIRSLREQQGLTLRALATKTKLSAPYLSDLEHNRRGAKPGTLDRIADALGIDVNVFEPVQNTLTSELKDWLNNSPEMVALLKEIRAKDRSPAELRTAMRKK